MKHIKLFENKNWTENLLFKHIDDTEYLEDIMGKYINWVGEWEYAVEIKYFYRNGEDRLNSTFRIVYTDADGEYHTYQVKDMKMFIEFINNPDMFSDVKKYNL